MFWIFQRFCIAAQLGYIMTTDSLNKTSLVRQTVSGSSHGRLHQLTPYPRPFRHRWVKPSITNLALSQLPLLPGSFDLITYSKSCGVLSMLEQTMGASNFFQGVSNYLERFKFRNADIDDLWEQMTIGSNTSLGSISRLMEGWVSRIDLGVRSLLMCQVLGTNLIKRAQKIMWNF